MHKILFSSGLAAAVLVAGAQTAAAATVDFNYDPVAQVMNVSLDDGSSFDFIIGTDQLGNGIKAFVGTSTYAADPGSFGDAVGSEWLITSDPVASENPPCDTPFYTGDPDTDFADCIAAITDDGGTYTIGQYAIDVPPGAGSNQEVYIGTTTQLAAASDDDTALSDAQVASIAATDAGTSGAARMTRNGFKVFKGTTFTIAPTKKVSAVDGALLKTLISHGIVKQEGNVYVVRKNYTFASPSQPAALILDNLVNGWRKWTTSAGVPLNRLYTH